MLQSPAKLYYIVFAGVFYSIFLAAHCVCSFCPRRCEKVINLSHTVMHPNSLQYSVHQCVAALRVSVLVIIWSKENLTNFVLVPRGINRYIKELTYINAQC